MPRPRPPSLHRVSQQLEGWGVGPGCCDRRGSDRPRLTSRAHRPTTSTRLHTSATIYFFNKRKRSVCRCGMGGRGRGHPLFLRPRVAALSEDSLWVTSVHPVPGPGLRAVQWPVHLISTPAGVSSRFAVRKLRPVRWRLVWLACSGGGGRGDRQVVQLRVGCSLGKGRAPGGRNGPCAAWGEGAGHACLQGGLFTGLLQDGPGWAPDVRPGGARCSSG